MSYIVYRNWKNARIMTDELNAGSNEDYLEEKIFLLLKACFNKMVETKKYNWKSTPYFDLKTNWELMKNHDYDGVLDNIREWLIAADNKRFNEWEEQNKK